MSRGGVELDDGSFLCSHCDGDIPGGFETCCDRAVKNALHEVALRYLSVSQAGSGDVTPAPEAHPPCVTP